VEEDVEDREDEVVVGVDGVVVVEEVSEDLEMEGWKSEILGGQSCEVLNLKSMVLDMLLGEEKSYARLGIIGVCG
jgi:hypothetical protein